MGFSVMAFSSRASSAGRSAAEPFTGKNAAGGTGSLLMKRSQRYLRKLAGWVMGSPTYSSKWKNLITLQSMSFS